MAASKRYRLSKYVGVTPLRNGSVLLRHVSSPALIQVRTSIYGLLKLFARPQSFEDVARDAGTTVEKLQRIFDLFLQADVLQPEKLKEEDRIRSAYLSKPPVLPDVPLLDAKRPISYPFTTDAMLELSKSLACFRLPKGEMLVTHPIGSRLHVSASLWSLARKFSKPISVKNVLKTYRSVLERAHVMDCLSFLFRRQILWQAGTEEQSLSSSYPSPASSIALTSLSTHFEQRFAPYQSTDLQRISKSASVAFLGYCQVQSTIPTLEFLGERQGWHIEAHGYLQADARLKKKPWSLIIFSPQLAAVRFHQAVAVEDFERANRLAYQVAADIEQQIINVRIFTSAPILIHSVGKPGISLTPPSSRVHQTLNNVFAHLNVEISKRTANYKQVFMLDEDGVVSQSGIFPFWDDIYHHHAHHTNLDFWTSAINMGIQLKPSLHPEKDTFPARHPSGTPMERAFPNRDASLSPTSIPFAQSYLHFLERLLLEHPVRMIVFEPEGLLWPGTLRARNQPFPKNYFFVGGADAVAQMGIHETLMGLKGRGIKLAVNSSTSSAILQDRWVIEEQAPNIVRLKDVDFMLSGKNKSEQLTSLIKQSGIRREEVLWIDPAANTKKFSGRIWNGSSWDLKKYLVTAPEFAPTSLEEGGPTLSEPDSGESTRSFELDKDEVKSKITERVCAELKCSKENLGGSDDLRLLGLSSLQAFNIAAALEKQFGFKFADDNMIESVLFFRSALLNACLRSARSHQTSKRPSDKKVGKNLTDDLDLKEWCAQDFREVLLKHFKTPTVPWIFKVIRSVQPFDYEYITWNQLAQKSQAYLELFQNLGLQEGDVISILLPTSLDGFASYTAALFGGFVPSMVPYPSEKLSLDSFGEWFTTVVEKSQTKCVLCLPVFHKDFEKVMSSQRLSTKIISESPLPSAQPIQVSKKRSGDQPLFLQHSSGTTGVKKAVLISHHDILFQAWVTAKAFEFQPGEISVSWLPLYHDLGLIMNFMVPLLWSMPTVMVSPHDWVKRPQILLEQISEERGSICWMPNFAFFHCANRIGDSVLRNLNLTSCKSIINGGEPITSEAFEMFFQKFAPAGLQRSALKCAYGMAEATALVTASPAGRPLKELRIDQKEFQANRVVKEIEPDQADVEKAVVISSGSPSKETFVEIINDKDEVLSEGKVGEIRLKTPSLMKQYFHDSESTKSALKNGWYYSGDLGFLYEGELFVTGRKKDLVIVAGHNIYPHDVEQFISNRVTEIYPGRIVVFGVFEPSQGTERLVLMAETKYPKDIQDNAALLQEAEQKTKMKIREIVLTTFAVPVSDIRFFAERTLFKSTSGKPSRSKNREFYLKLSKT